MTEALHPSGDEELLPLPVAPAEETLERHLQALPDNPELTAEQWLEWWENYIPPHWRDDVKAWHKLPEWRKDLQRIPAGLSAEEHAVWRKALGLTPVRFVGRAATAVYTPLWALE